MARFALIDTTKNLVVNVIIGQPIPVPPGFVAVASDSANIGDGFDGTNIVPQAQPAPPVTVPPAYNMNTLLAEIASLPTIKAQLSAQGKALISGVNLSVGL